MPDLVVTRVVRDSYSSWLILCVRELVVTHVYFMTDIVRDSYSWWLILRSLVVSVSWLIWFVTDTVRDSYSPWLIQFVTPTVGGSYCVHLWCLSRDWYIVCDSYSPWLILYVVKFATSCCLLSITWLILLVPSSSWLQ